MADAVLGMQAQLAGLLAHEHAPLALAQKASGVAAQAPLFTSVLNYRHGLGAGQGAADALDGITVIFTRERTNYPLFVSVDDTSAGFTVTVASIAPADPALV